MVRKAGRALIRKPKYQKLSNSMSLLLIERGKSRCRVVFEEAAMKNNIMAECALKIRNEVSGEMKTHPFRVKERHAAMAIVQGSSLDS